MIYALVRGWLAGMGALLIEILLAATLSASDLSGNFLAGDSISTTLPVVGVLVIAFIEEGMKFAALRGISFETKPFFRNAIFKGLLVGIGFAAFEASVKILFHTEANSSTLWQGALSSGLLHLTTGGILGTIWFLKPRNGAPALLTIIFLVALAVHVAYNEILSPLLFNLIS